MYLYPSPPQPPTPSHLHISNMKLSYQARALVLLFIILASSSTLSARLLLTTKGQDKVNYQVDLETIDELTGTENCDKGDEECFKRRVISEAHLDYIYTQHHKP